MWFSWLNPPIHCLYYNSHAQHGLINMVKPKYTWETNYQNVGNWVLALDPLLISFPNHYIDANKKEKISMVFRVIPFIYIYHTCFLKSVYDPNMGFMAPLAHIRLGFRPHAIYGYTWLQNSILSLPTLLEEILLQNDFITHF